MQIMHSDVTDLKLNDPELSFTISLQKGKLTLHASGEDDFAKWKEVLGKAYHRPPNWGQG